MTPLRVYFSLDYQRDLPRVARLHKLSNVLARSAGGFQTARVWQQAQGEGDASVRGLIDDALRGTSVTVVCIGMRSSFSKFLDYEIERSLAQGNGLTAVTINQIRHRDGTIDPYAPVPPAIEEAGFNVYPYTTQQHLRGHIEEAFELAKLDEADRLTAKQALVEAAPVVERRTKLREELVDGTVWIDGNIYPLRNWNPHGFLARFYTGDRRSGDEIEVVFAIQNGGKRLEFKCRAKIIWVDKSAQMIGGSYVEMGTELRQTIARHFQTA